MGFMKEFKAFAIKGNVIDLAVGVVIGGAFGKIVASLVDDIITPAVLNPVLEAAHLKNLSELVIPGTAIKYGNFISTFITFLIIAFTLFLVIKGVNKLKAKEEKKPVEPSKEEILLTEIRDLLAAKK